MRPAVSHWPVPHWRQCLGKRDGGKHEGEQLSTIETIPSRQRAAHLECTRESARRFDRVAITCVFGEPRHPASWSGAPHNLASAFERLGIAVESIYPRIDRIDRLGIVARHVVQSWGQVPTGEEILRAAPARSNLAHQVARIAARRGLREVLHTGSFDLPAPKLPPGIRHYLYCDHTWALSLRHRPDAARYGARTIREFARLEREAYEGLEHIFTFGAYVRDNLIQYYGVPPERVTAVGSGTGPISPFFGTKDYARPHLLFVAKHLFEAKGGILLLDAFRIALRARPDLHLTIVGDERSRRFVPQHPNITVHDRLSWEKLEALFHSATLLSQPMLNDPWGQVYLEALASRTPVLGLRRNGLPEITGNGACGFLVDQADPHAVAAAIVAAAHDPDRLAQMGLEGQRRVLSTYSWDRVAARMASPSAKNTPLAQEPMSCSGLIA
jgi:glycosyltransferase involved in cell wall biosynthesis